MEKLEILNVEKELLTGELKILIETPYGVDNMGILKKRVYLDPDTNKPQWIGEIKYLLENKYGKEVLIEDLETALNKTEKIIEL